MNENDNLANMFHNMLKLLPTLEEAVESNTFIQADDEILSRDERAINALADFFEDIGLTDVVTGFYDPEEDARDGLTDHLTGYYYLSL